MELLLSQFVNDDTGETYTIEDAEAREDIESLKTKNESLESEISSLQTTINSLQNSINSINEQLADDSVTLPSTSSTKVGGMWWET